MIMCVSFIFELLFAAADYRFFLHDNQLGEPYSYFDKTILILRALVLLCCLEHLTLRICL